MRRNLIEMWRCMQRCIYLLEHDEEQTGAIHLGILTYVVCMYIQQKKLLSSPASPSPSLSDQSLSLSLLSCSLSDSPDRRLFSSLPSDCQLSIHMYADTYLYTYRSLSISVSTMSPLCLCRHEHLYANEEREQTCLYTYAALVRYTASFLVFPFLGSFFHFFSLFFFFGCTDRDFRSAGLRKVC